MNTNTNKIEFSAAAQEIIVAYAKKHKRGVASLTDFVAEVMLANKPVANVGGRPQNPETIDLRKNFINELPQFAAMAEGFTMHNIVQMFGCEAVESTNLLRHFESLGMLKRIGKTKVSKHWSTLWAVVAMD